MNIKLIVNNCNVKVVGHLPKNVTTVLDNYMSYTHQGQQFVARKFGYGWDGVIRLFKNNTFPIGLLEECEKIFKNFKIEYTIEDQRCFFNKPDSLEISDQSNFVPRHYQISALKSAIKNKHGIVKAATGSGKTATIAMIVGHYNVPTVIYVIGVELLYQMKSTIEWLYPDVKVGIVGDGKCDVQKITIATIWSAAAAFNKKAETLDSDLTSDRKKISSNDKEKVRDMVSSAKMFILDECQFAAANTVQFLHRSSKNAAHRFLFSASPWRDTGDDILIEAVAGKRIFDISASKLINEGFLVKPKIYFVDVPAMRGVGSNYHEVYKNYIVENSERNSLIIKSAKKLLDKGKKILILVVRVGHGSVLLSELEKEGISSDFLDGKKSTKKRLQCIQDMKDGKIDVLVASKIFDQGVDIPELDALILAGSGKSSGRALQRIGRVIRLFEGKEIATVVEFMDNAKYLRDHSNARMNVYRSEPEFEIIVQKPKDPNSYVKTKKVRWN